MTASDSRAVLTTGGAPAWYRRVDWSASVWVLLLLIPLVTVLRAPSPLPLRGLAATAVLAFGATYVWTVSTMRPWYELPTDASLREQLGHTAGRLVVLAALVALTVPVAGWWYVFFMPYFSAILLYSCPLRSGIALTSLLLIVNVVAAVLLASRAPGVVQATLGCCGSSVFILVGRLSADVQERRRVKEAELAASREREEIGRDVHDILGHSLTVLTLKTEVARRLVRADPGRAEAELDEILELSRSALADVRGTVTRLRTPDLDSQLEASRTAFAAAGIRAHVVGRVRDVPVDQRGLVAWALREATTNVARHADARHVEVVLAPGLLRVSDDGVGMAQDEPGNGLSGLRERVESAGGSLRVTSPATGPAGQDGQWGPGPGTSVEVVL